MEVPQIFASYNKVGQLMTGGKEAQLESLLLNPTISDTGDYLEVSTKSFDAETGIHLGWVYLRLSTREINDLTQRAIFTHLAAVVILLIIAFYTAFKMQLGISNPIKSLTHFLQQTSRHIRTLHLCSKDWEISATSRPWSELSRSSPTA